jgi:hypothetical protein
VLSALAAMATLALKLALKWQEWREIRCLKKRLWSTLYTAEDINRTVKFYVRPDCQSVDPSGAEDFRRTIAVRNDLFKTVDNLLQHPWETTFLIVLADSGVGKRRSY